MNLCLAIIESEGGPGFEGPPLFTALILNLYSQPSTRPSILPSYQEETRVETAIVSSSSTGAESSKEEQQRNMEQDEEQPLSLSEIKLELGAVERG